MTQLWLDGRRMDSIPLLRRFMDECQEEQRSRRLLSELIKRYQSGSLSAWMTRQNEARPMSQLAQKGLGVETQLHILTQTPPKPVREVLPVLADLCAQEKEKQREYLARLEEIVEDELLDPRQLNKEKQELIEKQAWYSGQHSLFAHIDWNNVAIDSMSFSSILQRIKRESPKPQTTIYLCNIGNIYMLHHPLEMQNVRLVGCGNPTVHVDSVNRQKELNMTKQELVFENFVLYRQGMILSGTTNRMNGIKVI